MNNREQNVYTLARLGIGADTIARVNRALPAIQRAHEAECNWPESVAAPFVKAGDAAWARLCRSLSGWQHGFTVARQGDPRGACVVLTVDGVEHRLAGDGFTAAQVERIDQLALNRF